MKKKGNTNDIPGLRSYYFQMNISCSSEVIKKKEKKSKKKSLCSHKQKIDDLGTSISLNKNKSIIPEIILSSVTKDC